ncbi:MAG: sulfurtransferase TusA family protein [Acinetobacter sp.]|jgi:tRNA 2-thiouridine synthesizing protein A|nr:MAG: sulfurtransferase TusA family protein [Acinetobacter sp.]
MIHPHHIVDARQQPCPMPILMLKRALKSLAKGQIILVQSTDPHSQQDLTHFCQVQGLTIHHSEVQHDEFYYYIES